MITEVYGIYGIGEEKEGFVNIISDSAGLVNKDSIGFENRGQILVAGSLMLEATIKKAINCSVAGIICGGMNMDDYLAMIGSLNPDKKINSDIGVSIVGTEGFGVIPMGEDIFDLFKKYVGKFAIIQGNSSTILLPSDDPNSVQSCRKVGLASFDDIRPKPPLEVSEIKLGLRVRLIAPPFMGSQGEVVAIDSTPTRLESGISTYLIMIATKNKKIKTAFSNVELI